MPYCVVVEGFLIEGRAVVSHFVVCHSWLWGHDPGEKFGHGHAHMTNVLKVVKGVAWVQSRRRRTGEKLD